MSENNNNDTSKTQRGPSIRRLMNMPYMEILENYLEYPQPANIDPDTKRKYKYKFIPMIATSNLNEATNIFGKINFKSADKPQKTDFLSEKDKADGWIQKFSNNKRFSKFLQTNLHYLPEHLWSKMKPFYQENVHVGYKVSDGNVHFFVHCAESTDEISRALLDSIKDPNNIDREYLKDLVVQLEERLNNDSWLTIRANRYLSV